LKVFVDAMSGMYLEGVRIDYIESLEGSGFKIENPNAKRKLGCGQSFQA
jgi:iron-sulfur cluster assembly accessory protein